MLTVVNVDSIHSGLCSAFQHVHTIELRESPLGAGSFGDVYDCVSINGASPDPPQVVKILRDNGNGSADKGFETIRKLQQKIIENNEGLSALQKPRLESLPALRALPQFSFLGEMDGRQVLGYSADRLDPEEYISFSMILEDSQLRGEYLTLTIDDRLLLATEMVEGFQALAEMSFIHADINAPNLLINIKDCHLAIIDYDSGAVTDAPDDKPTTFGKKDDWLAPEIQDQMNPQTPQQITVKVDLFTDTWAVFIGIHHLLFLCHPLFYLESLSSSNIRSYLEAYQWPSIDTIYPLFSSFVEPKIYHRYRDLLNLVPDAVLRKLSVTMNKGFREPTLRTSYKQWALTLRAVQRGPEIAYFIADKETIVAGMRTRLSWSVSGAHKVLIDNGIGEVDLDECLDLTLTESQLYTLTARARNGESVSAYVSVRVWPVPVLRSLQVPTCSIRQRISLHTPRTAPPQIHIPVTLSLGVHVTEPALKRGAAERLEVVRARMPTRIPKAPGSRRARLDSIFNQLKSTISQLVGDLK
jgi:serine/threonine protein kinase